MFYRRRPRRRTWSTDVARRGGGSRGVAGWPELLDRRDVVILDTETTGLDSDAEVIEVALINTRGERLVQKLALPKGRIPRSASRIHGLTLDTLKREGASDWTQVHQDLMPALRAATTVIVYNAAFDRRLLQQTSARHNLALPDIAWHCAMLDYKAFHGAGSGYGLQQAFLRECDENHVQEHRALADCQMVLELMQAVAGRR